MTFCSTCESKTDFTSCSHCSFSIPCPETEQALVGSLLSDVLRGYDLSCAEQSFCTALKNGTIGDTTVALFGQRSTISLTYATMREHEHCDDPNCRCHTSPSGPLVIVTVTVRHPAQMRYLPFESDHLSVQQQLTGVDCRILESIATEIRYAMTVEHIPHSTFLRLQNKEALPPLQYDIQSLDALLHSSVLDLVKATYDTEKHECFQFAPTVECRKRSVTSTYVSGEPVITEAGYRGVSDEKSTRSLLMRVDRQMSSNPRLSLYCHYWYINKERVIPIHSVTMADHKE